MPEMDGYEATRHIREGTRPGIDPTLTVIAMTAHALADDRRRCIEAGMNDYVSKPVDLKRLEEALTKWLPAGEDND